MSDKKFAHVDPGLTFDTAKELLTVGEAAVLLRLGRSTLYALINEHKLPVVKMGRRILIPKIELREYIERNLHA
jgi:excisionase family DNA binding protein